jgi:hypothetical protein
MSDMTQDQIDREFVRQVKLCSGLGRDRMIEIVTRQFPKTHRWEFTFNGTFCRDCGCAMRDNDRECRT